MDSKRLEMNNIVYQLVHGVATKNVLGLFFHLVGADYHMKRGPPFLSGVRGIK